MSAERIHENPEEIEEDDQYLEGDDVYLEVADDGDQPMDDDDDEGVMYEGEGPGPDDEIVFEDTSIQHFPDHKRSVFAVSAHPTFPIAASGGEDDLGYIWDYSTGDVIVKLTGHTDSVTSTAFNSDGEMIATGGMDGKVRVWRRRGTQDYKTWEFLTELQGPDEVMVCLHAFLQMPSRSQVRSLQSSGCGGIRKETFSSRAPTTPQYGYGNVSTREFSDPHAYTDHSPQSRRGIPCRFSPDTPLLFSAESSLQMESES